MGQIGAICADNWLRETLRCLRPTAAKCQLFDGTSQADVLTDS